MTKNYPLRYLCRKNTKTRLLIREKCVLKKGDYPEENKKCKQMRAQTHTHTHTQHKHTHIHTHTKYFS